MTTTQSRVFNVYVLTFVCLHFTLSDTKDLHGVSGKSFAKIVRLCYTADVKFAGFRSLREASSVSCHSDELWWQYICSSPVVGSTLAKELTVATRLMQSSSKVLGALVYESVKCKQKEVDTFTLNSLIGVGSAAGFDVMSSGWRKVNQVSIPAWIIWPYWWVVIQSKTLAVCCIALTIIYYTNT